MMKFYISIILFWLSTLFSYAYKLGDVVVTKEGDLGVVFYVDQEKALLIAVSEVATTTDFCTDVNPDLGDYGINDQGAYQFNGRKKTQKLLDLSSKYKFPILEYVPTDRGWYLPTATELLALYLSDRTGSPISNVLTQLGGARLNAERYVTCTIRKTPAIKMSYTLGFENFVCDLTVKSNVLIRPMYQIDLAEEPAESNYTYLWSTGGTGMAISDKPSETTTYSVTMNDPATGCKSTDSRTVLVARAGIQEISDTICEGETYEKYGFKESAAGDYSKTVEQGGCSLDVLLHLTVAPKYKREFNDNICFGRTYNKHGFSVTPFVTGEFHDTLNFISKMGCDSTVIIHLNVNPITFDTIIRRVCQSDSYKDSDFDIPPYQRSGLNYYTIEKSNGGCRSYHTLALQVDPTYQVSLVDEVIMGDDYNKNGFNIENVMSDGAYTLNLKSVNGCDSIVNLSIVAKDTFTRDNKTVIITNITDVICEGETYIFKDQSLTNAGVYTDTVENFSTLDVTVLALEVKPSIMITISDSVMVGCSYYLNGMNLDSVEKVGDFQYTITNQSIYGCDSIVTLNLRVYPLKEEHVNPEKNDDHVIPTVFSPSNEDNSNDFFMKGYEVYIYDRYGNFVAYSTDGWDGRRRGEFADPGVYAYVIIMKNGEKKKGTIEVLK